MLTAFLLFMVFMVSNGNDRGIRHLLLDFWEQADDFGLDLRTEKPVSASAICQARERLNPDLFRDLLYALSNEDCDEVGPMSNRRWRGRRVFAIDGAKINLRRSPDHTRAFGVPKGAHSPQALMSQLVDVYTRTPIDFEFSGFRSSEREHALRMLDSLDAGNSIRCAAPCCCSTTGCRTPYPTVSTDLSELQALVTPYAAGLEMVRIARRSLASHVLTSIRLGFRACFTASSWGRKLVAMFALVLCGWAFYGHIDYSVNAPAQLRPIASRKLAAASDGVLLEVLVRPGDEVKAGDVLCQFDTSATELEHSRLMSELAILDVERYRALNGGSPSEVQLTGAQARAVRANVALIEHRLENSAVRATVDGVILTGDHRDRLGDSFPKGELLFEIAEHRGWMLDLKVTENDIADISLNLQGQFASHAKPEESHAFEITNIAPAALPHEGLITFKVEAQCDLPSGWPRSGMAGYASIDVGTRTPAWVAFHRILDFARLHIWL
ncbi:MAG: hypothetical protein ACI8X5_003849 [Planctomycetota bacterium]